MVAVSLSLNDFDFIVHTFQLSSMDGVVAVIQDAIAVCLQHACELLDLRMWDTPGQGTPFFQGFNGPGSGFIAPDMLQFVAQDQDSADHFIQLKQLSQMLPLLDSPKVGPILQKEVTSSFENGFVFFGGFPIFGPPDLVDDSGEVGDDMKKIEDDLDMRDFLLDGFDVRIPHVHGYGFQPLPVAFGHLGEETIQGFGSPVLPNPDHTSSLVIENHGQVTMAFADGDLVDRQDPDAAGVDLSILEFQEVLVDPSDSLPVQSQMLGHFLDCQHLAEFVDVKGQAFCDSLAGGEKLQVFDNDPPAVKTDNLAVMAFQPNSKGGKIQVSNPSLDMAVDPSRNSSTATANKEKPFVGTDIDPSWRRLLSDGLMDDLDSTKREIICYTHSGHRKPPWVSCFGRNLFYPLELHDVHFLLSTQN